MDVWTITTLCSFGRMTTRLRKDMKIQMRETLTYPTGSNRRAGRVRPAQDWGFGFGSGWTLPREKNVLNDHFEIFQCVFHCGGSKNPQRNKQTKKNQIKTKKSTKKMKQKKIQNKSKCILNKGTLKYGMHSLHSYGHNKPSDWNTGQPKLWQCSLLHTLTQSCHFLFQ